jgi:hypothetical protein
MIGTKKFRPYFTAPELLELISALKESPTPARMNLIRYLETFSIKIERGVMEPSHVIEGTKSEKTIQAMGFAEIPADLAEKISPVQLYDKWKSNPTECSPAELEKVIQYRWENGLMTESESADYINSLY